MEITITRKKKKTNNMSKIGKGRLHFQQLPQPIYPALTFVTSSTIPQFNLMMDATHTQDADRSHVSLVQKLMEKKDVTFKVVRNDADDLYA